MIKCRGVKFGGNVNDEVVFECQLQYGHRLLWHIDTGIAEDGTEYIMSWRRKQRKKKK